MKKKFDINICYRKVFETVSSECNIQKIIDMIADYTGVSFVIVDIGGKVLAVSAGLSENSPVSKEEADRHDTIISLISQCVEVKEKGEKASSLHLKAEEKYCEVNTIEVKGNTEGFCILIPEDDDLEDAPVFGQVNDIVCQALGMIFERQGVRVHYHSSTIRRMIARSLFEGEERDGLRGKEIQKMYDAYVMKPFMIAVLKLKKDHVLRLQKAGNSLIDTYPNSFVYIKDNLIFALFSDIYMEDQKAKLIYMLNDMCDNYEMVCAVSEIFDDIDLIEKKKFLVTQALRIGEKTHAEQNLHQEYDYYIQIVCSCAAPFIGNARYLEQPLNRLKQEDQVKGTEFYNTLKEYLLHGNNVSMTSKHLYIHRNTMIYRLSKINEILGVDINDPKIARQLMISIVLQEQENME